MITNMDGSDHRKLTVIGKSKTPCVLHQKYKMKPEDMAVDWYSSKNAWMTGDIHHKVMTKLNKQMRWSNRHILYICDNAAAHQVKEYSHIKFLMLPPNATSILQPLDQGIIMSTKRRYKKKLAERYLACVESGKDAQKLLKSLDVVQATNMIAASWRETSSTIIQNCFRKAGFKHHNVDPEPEPEEPAPAPQPAVWQRVQRWLGDVQFEQFATAEVEDQQATSPMTDDEIVNLVRTENDPDPEHESDDEEIEPAESAKIIRNSSDFLAVVDQQRAFFKRYNMSTDIIDELEEMVVDVQTELCSNQKQMSDYFKSVPVTDLPKDVSLVDSLVVDDDDFELESVNTTVASVAVSALLKNLPGNASTPKRQRPPVTCTPKRKQEIVPPAEPSTSTGGETFSRPPMQKKLKLTQAVDKVMNITCSSFTTESDSESLFSQE